MPNIIETVTPLKYLTISLYHQLILKNIKNLDPYSGRHFPFLKVWHILYASSQFFVGISNKYVCITYLYIK